MGSLPDGARIGDILQTAVARLGKAGIEGAQTDAELLLGHCLGKSRTELYLLSAETIDEMQYAAYDEMIGRRCRREPVAYITGEREFWSQRFIVTPDVLIPRPETEFLVESILRARQKFGEDDLCLDLCCGSGVIGIVLAIETNCRVIATDISHEALTVCRMNCEQLGTADRVLPVQADLAACLAPEAQFAVITANPPYVRRGEIAAELEPDVAAFEPHLALDGGLDGLDLIKRIVESIPLLLQPGGDFFMEIGHDQGERVEHFIAENTREGLYDTVEILKDYAERDRVAHVRKK